MKSIDSQTDLPEYVLELLNEIGSKEGLTDFSVVLSSGSKHGDGFMGIILRIIIKGKKDGKSHELYVILKIPPSSTITREQLYTRPAFEREIYMYTVVFPTFVKFQKECGLTEENGFYDFPKCYAAISDVKNDRYALVLEDLCFSGYEMWTKHKDIDIDHVKLIMQKLGRFHAISFAMRDKNPEIFAPFEEMRNTLIDQWINNPETLEPMLNNALDDAIASFRSSEVDIIVKMKKIKVELGSILLECLNKSLAAPFHVINHGDFWNNNIMFLYNETKNPTTLRFIDWQYARVCSPATDIVYFLFCSTDQTLRDSHYESLLNIYHTALAKSINHLGSDANQIFTFSDLKNQLKQFGKFGLISAPILLQVVAADPEDFPDLDEMAENMARKEGTLNANFNEHSQIVFNKRVSDAIRHIIALGYY